MYGRGDGRQETKETGDKGGAALAQKVFFEAPLEVELSEKAIKSKGASILLIHEPIKISCEPIMSSCEPIRIVFGLFSE